MPNFHDRVILLNPATDASGGTPAASAAPASAVSPAAPVAAGNAPSNPAPAPSPTPQPAGRTITDVEYQQFRTNEGRARAHESLLTRFKGLGYGNIEDAVAGAEKYRRISSDDSLRSIVESLMPTQPGAPQQPGVTQPNGQPFDPSQLPGLVQAEFAKAMQAHETAAQQREHASLVQQENHLLAASVSDPRFKALFGETTFNDAYDGKGSKVAKLTAVLMDAACAEIADKYGNGAPKPISDPAKMQQVRDTVYGAIQELRASVLLQASTNGAEDIRSYANREPAPGAPPERFDPQSPWPSDEQVNKTFEASFNRALAG